AIADCSEKDRFYCLVNLANALRGHYELGGGRELVHEAWGHLLEALKTENLTADEEVIAAANLALCGSNHFHGHSDVAILTEAASRARAVYDKYTSLEPPVPELALLGANTSGLLLTSYEVLGDVHLLDNAVEMARNSI